MGLPSRCHSPTNSALPAGQSVAKSSPLTEAVAGASFHDTAKSNAERSGSQGELNGAQRAGSVPEGQLTHGDARTDPPTVSPTIPWTNLPATVRGPGCQLVVAMMCDADVCGLIPTTRLKKAFEWGVKQPPGGTRFRMLRAQFWTLAQSKYIQKGPKSGPS